MRDFRSPPPPMKERLAEMWRRLGPAPPLRNADEALRALCETVDAVEDELSGVEKDTEAAALGNTGGRIYPPTDQQRMRKQPDGVLVFGHTAHTTWIGENGSIEIRRRSGEIEFEKRGEDGRSVADILREKNP